MKTGLFSFFINNLEKVDHQTRATLSVAAYARNICFHLESSVVFMAQHVFSSYHIYKQLLPEKIEKTRWRPSCFS